MHFNIFNKISDCIYEIINATGAYKVFIAGCNSLSFVKFPDRCVTMTKKIQNKKRLYVKHLMNTKEFMRDTGRLSI